MNVCNNTDLDLATIQGYVKIKEVKSLWRQRNISLYQDPEDGNKVYSVGVNFDGKTTIVCRETRADWARELANPAFYVTTE